MFYLEFKDVNEFAKHLKSHAIDEAFVVTAVPDGAVFRNTTFTALINDYIALCTQIYNSEAKD